MHYQRSAPFLYGLAVVLLIGVIIAGDSTNGSQRWLVIGPIRFQPSELVKVAIPLMVAWILAAEATRPDLKKIGICLLVTAVPAGLIFIQPDLDGAIFTVIYALFVLYFAGMSWKIIGSFLATVATASRFYGYSLWKRIRKSVLLSFLTLSRIRLVQATKLFNL